MITGIRSICGFALAAIFALALVSHADSADLLVYNNNDSGPGSLRQALLDHNASAGGNTIIFSNIVTGTILLTNGELLMTKHGTISGPGPGILAVDGSGSNRVFHIQITNHNTSALITGLTITNGVATNLTPDLTARSGGGIWNDHSVMRIDNCVLTGNRAYSYGGGIWNDGSATNSASIIVENCTLTNNSAGAGGAISGYGYQGASGVTVRNSTLVWNTAVVGGAIYNDAYAGIATVRVNNSTISSNLATVTGDFVGGGGIFNYGVAGNASLFVNSSTFTGNSAVAGSCIYNTAPVGSASVEIGNTILQAGASGGTFSNKFGPVTSRGYNLSSDGGGGVLNHATDQTNTAPLLKPLANNGGRTFTHALAAGSPAVDRGKWNAITSGAITLDQRGALRPYNFASITNAVGGDGSDIGAFELTSPQLNLQQVGGNAVLSWPSYCGDFILQSTTNLSSWVSAGGVPTVVGNQFQQTNGPISGNQFFRLRGN